MSKLKRFKGLLKLSLGVLLVAPSPVGLAVGIPLEATGKNEQNAIIAQFETTPEYEQAVEYRNQRLAYIKEHMFDEDQNKLLLQDEQKYLEKDIKSTKGYMNAILKESEFGQAYASASHKNDAGFETALIGGFGGAIFTIYASYLVGTFYKKDGEDDPIFAISYNLIRGGAIQTFGREDKEND